MSHDYCKTYENNQTIDKHFQSYFHYFSFCVCWPGLGWPLALQLTILSSLSTRCWWSWWSWKLRWWWFNNNNKNQNILLLWWLSGDGLPWPPVGLCHRGRYQDAWGECWCWQAWSSWWWGWWWSLVDLAGWWTIILVMRIIAANVKKKVL